MTWRRHTALRELWRLSELLRGRLCRRRRGDDKGWARRVASIELRRLELGCLLLRRLELRCLLLLLLRRLKLGSLLELGRLLKLRLLRRLELGRLLGCSSGELRRPRRSKLRRHLSWCGLRETRGAVLHKVNRSMD